MQGPKTFMKILIGRKSVVQSAHMWHSQQFKFKVPYLELIAFVMLKPIVKLHCAEALH